MHAQQSENPYDSRDFWKNHNYRNYGITGEPYYDTDFSKVLYLTDTGRLKYSPSLVPLVEFS